MGLPHSVSSVSQSVQFSWFRETSRASDFREIPKVPQSDNETWPFGPILKALTPNDAADREDLQPSPQIRNFSPSVGTSEICDFQFYANSLVFWPRPVASVRGVDLAWQQVVAEKIGTGNFSQPTCCCLLTTSGHCPGSLNVPPGTPTLRATLPSRSASVKHRYLGGLSQSGPRGGPPTPFSQSVQSVSQLSWFRETSRASDFREFPKDPKDDNET